MTKRPADAGAAAPERIQRRRTRGWRMRERAIYVGRPSAWGNPAHFDWFVGFASRAAVVASYRIYAERRLAREPDWLAPLRGHDLACWCRPSDLCHGDVLLTLANR